MHSTPIRDSPSFELAFLWALLLVPGLGPPASAAAQPSGNIFIWVPRQRVLCLMDFLFTGSAPFPYLGHAEDIPSFLEHHDFALAYDFERFITGHIAEPATRADVERQRRYLSDLRDHTDAVLEEITIPATAARLGDVPIMGVVATYLDDVAREVERRMLETWRGRWPDGCSPSSRRFRFRGRTAAAKIEGVSRRNADPRTLPAGPSAEGLATGCPDLAVGVRPGAGLGDGVGTPSPLLGKNGRPRWAADPPAPSAQDSQPCSISECPPPSSPACCSPRAAFSRCPPSLTVSR